MRINITEDDGTVFVIHQITDVKTAKHLLYILDPMRAYADEPETTDKAEEVHEDLVTALRQIVLYGN